MGNTSDGSMARTLSTANSSAATRIGPGMSRTMPTTRTRSRTMGAVRATAATAACHTPRTTARTGTIVMLLDLLRCPSRLKAPLAIAASRLWVTWASRILPATARTAGRSGQTCRAMMPGHSSAASRATDSRLRQCRHLHQLRRRHLLHHLLRRLTEASTGSNQAWQATVAISTQATRLVRPSRLLSPQWAPRNPATRRTR